MGWFYLNEYAERLEQEYAFLREYIVYSRKFQAERQQNAEKNSAFRLRVQTSRAVANTTIQRAQALCQEAKEIRGVNAIDKTLP